MELINNRYRVVEKVKATPLISTYRVIDLSKQYTNLYLNIFNSDNLPEELLDFLKNEFYPLSEIDSEEVIKVYNLGLVINIDGKQLKNKSYFYTEEGYENERSIDELIEHSSYNKRLELFVNLCKGLNYLRVRKYNLNKLKLNSLYIYSENNEFNMKIKNPIDIKIEEYDYWTDTKEEISESTDYIKDLGEILLRLYNNKDNSDTKDENHKEFSNNICIIAEKMILENWDLIRIVKEVNKIFKTNYREISLQEINKINYSTKLLGRETEIDLIKNCFQNNRSGIFLIHGENGIGKTRMLRELKYWFEINKHSVFSSFSLDGFSINSNKGLTEILKQIISNSEEAIVKEYENELKYFVPNVLDKEEKADIQNLLDKKERYKLLERIATFINTSMDNKSTVFIIDNIHYADEFTINIIKHLYRISRENKNLLVIVSFTDKESTNNNALMDFVDRFDKEEDLNEIELKGLTYEDIEKMIKNILRLDEIDKSVIRMIKEKTYGNPLFVVEIIKDLVTREVLFFNEENYAWEISQKNYDEIAIPQSIETLLFNEIKDIDAKCLETLQIISLFTSYISLDILRYFYENRIDVMDNSINELIERRILLRNLENGEYNIDFSNRILKRLVYSRIAEGDKRKLHSRACEILKNDLKDRLVQYEELIYHLERIKDYQGLIKYSLVYADKMEKLKNCKVAIKYLEKVIEKQEFVKDGDLILNINKKLGELYQQQGEFSISQNYYNIAVDAAKKQKNLKAEIDILNNLCKIYFKKNKIDRCSEIIKDIDLLLNNTDYLEGYLKSRNILADVLIMKRQYDEAKCICDEGIKLCQDSYLQEQGNFYNAQGSVYYSMGNMNLSKVAFQKALECFEEIQYDEGIVKCLNNLGVIYGDFEQNEELSISCFKEMEQISRINNMPESQLIALTNLAETYFYFLEYDKAIYNFYEALSISKRIDYENITFYCYSFICDVYLKMNKYDSSDKYYDLAMKELENYPIQGKGIGEHYRVSADRYFIFGDLESAEYHINEALDMYKGDEIFLRWNSEIIYQYIKLSKAYLEKDIYEILEEIHFILSKITLNSIKLEIVYRTVVILYRKGLKECYIQFMERYSKISYKGEASQIQLKKLFLQLCNEDSFNPQNINDILTSLKQSPQCETKWRIYEKLGDYYMSIKEQYSALNYYFEACEIIKKLTLKVSPKAQLSYFNFNRLYSPFVKIKNIVNVDDFNKSIQIKSIEELHSLLEQNDVYSILNNKEFINFATKSSNSGELIFNLKPEPIDNLELILQYLCDVTLATRGLVIIDDKDEKFKVLASKISYGEEGYDLNIINRVRKTKEPVILTGESNYKSKDIKGAICIPLILSNSEENKYVEIEKRSNYYYNKKIQGYLYLDTDRIINNFNYDSFKLCNKFNTFISIFIEKIKLYKISSIDKLTGTYTRQYLEEALADMMYDNEINNGMFSILMFDVDDFKSVNDKFGHQTGDKVLEQISKLVISNIRKEDIVGRYGGEEFIVILPGVGENHAVNIGNKLRRIIQEAKILGDKRSITVSIGVAVYPLHSQWKDELIEKADKALYIAKENGKNRCQLWSNKYNTQNKYTNKLLGIISGNAVQDNRNVLAMVELINLIGMELFLENKIYILLGRIIEITEASKGSIIIIENNEIKFKWGRKALKDNWFNDLELNKDIVNNVIETKQGVFMIDWDDITEYDSVTGVPIWKSIIVVPVIKFGSVKAVIYLKSPRRVKEFNFEEFNFVSVLGGIVAGIID